MSEKKYICIHGHFYQPPRENPWTEEVELQDSAYPYHDWNDRITAECYAPNTASRILDSEGRIIDIVNNYRTISFNFGPTLLAWLKSRRPDIYAAVIEADRASIETHSGHGSALAQVYNHIIMPLAGTKDKHTQVIWGIRDFAARFGRHPEGMWLAETAVDTETLEVLARHKIRFTILSPYQAKSVRKLASPGAEWADASGGKIDPTMPYLCRLPSGKTISIFFYDGPISQDLAFGGMLRSGEAFANRLLSVFSKDERPQLVHIATDGETYGHHQQYGDMALSYCIHYIQTNKLATITNYGDYLERFPPTYEVRVFDNSSWSCYHGVERWQSNCGCNSGMHQGWHQLWRRPLRDALDWLRDTLAPIYESQMSRYVRDPWEARNDYISVILDRTPDSIDAFFARNAVRELAEDEKVNALKLLEMQRNALYMYTSCGWFFDEVSGIETTQVLQYSARAIQLAEEISGTRIEARYLERLEKAPSNIPEYGNGARVYEMFAKPAKIDLLRVGAHYAISSLFEEYPKDTKVYCYSARSEVYDITEYGKLKLFIGKVKITSDITRETSCISCAALHMGDQNANCGVKPCMDDETFSNMQRDLHAMFDRGDTLQVIKLMEDYFGTNNYSLWHLFKEEQRKVLDQITSPILDSIETFSRQVYENNYPVMNFIHNLQIPIPRPLSMLTGHLANIEMMRVFQEESINLRKLRNLVGEIKKWNYAVNGTKIGLIASTWIDAVIERIANQPDDTKSMEKLAGVLSLMNSIDIDLNLWKAQNTYFALSHRFYRDYSGRAANGSPPHEAWIRTFRELGRELRMKVEP